MFSQVTRKIYDMESDIAAANSRITQCENSIYHIKHDTYNDEPLWNRAVDTECKVGDLTATVCKLQIVVEELKTSLDTVKASILELQAALEPKADASTENPKEKADLEIFKQNGYIDLDDVKTGKGIWELYDENWWNK